MVICDMWGVMVMKSYLIAIFIGLATVTAAKAEEKKGFWASLVPDNSSALTIVEGSKDFLGQLLEDSKKTGKALIDGGKDVIENTGDTIKSLTNGE